MHGVICIKRWVSGLDPPFHPSPPPHHPFINFLKKLPPEVFLKNSQNSKENARDSVYGVNISNFNLSGHFFWIWKSCFHIASAPFSPFHKLQLCSYIGKFWYIYVIGNKTKKKFHRFFRSLLPPPRAVAY